MLEIQAVDFGRRFTIASILLGFFWVLPVAHAQNQLQSWQNQATRAGGRVLEPRIGFFSSAENFDATGERTALASAEPLTWTTYDVAARWAWSDSLTLFGRLSAVSAKFNSAGAEIRDFGLADQLLGLAYRLKTHPHGLSISAQLDLSLPLYQNSKLKEDHRPFLGDGSTDLVIGTFAELPLPIGATRAWYWESGVGFRGRSSGFSSALPWSASIKTNPNRNGLMLHLGARGQISLHTDADSSPPLLSESIMGAGGSFIVDTPNPSWTQLFGMGGYRLQGGTVFFASTQIAIGGKNAASGLQIGLGFQWDLSQTTGIREHETRSTTESPTSRRGPRFGKNNSDSYNLESEILSTQDQLYLVKVDHGSGDGIQIGQNFDIFKPLGNISVRPKETRVARARVTAVKNSEAVLTVIEYFVDQWVEVGFVAKRLVQ